MSHVEIKRKCLTLQSSSIESSLISTTTFGIFRLESTVLSLQVKFCYYYARFIFDCLAINNERPLCKPACGSAWLAYTYNDKWRLLANTFEKQEIMGVKATMRWKTTNHGTVHVNFM